MEIQPWAMHGGRIFAHELGHNLGSAHEAPYATDCGEVHRGSPGYYPSFPRGLCGHTDFTSSPPVYTIMSYGRGGGARGVPYCSTVSRQPNGWSLGDPLLANNEAGFRDVTLPHVMSVGELALPRWNGITEIGGVWVGRDKIRLAWTNVGTPRGYGGSRVKGYAWARLDTSDSWDLFGIDEVSEGGGIRAVISGLRPGGQYYFYVGDMSALVAVRSPAFSGAPVAPSNVAADVTGPNSARVRWRDNANNEDGFEIWHRKWSDRDEGVEWRRYGERLPAGTLSADVGGLAAEEEIDVTEHYRNEEGVWNTGKAMRGRYSFVVVAYNDSGYSASETYDFEFMPGPPPVPRPSGSLTDCLLRETGLELGSYRVLACLETPDGSRRRAWNYRLDAEQSGLLYFFERDNVEILVKLLEGCAINGHHWVFVAPVTDLGFRLAVRESRYPVPGRRHMWDYDSKRRSQDRI